MKISARVYKGEKYGIELAHSFEIDGVQFRLQGETNYNNEASPKFARATLRVMKGHGYADRCICEKGTELWIDAQMEKAVQELLEVEAPRLAKKEVKHRLADAIAFSTNKPVSIKWENLTSGHLDCACVDHKGRKIGYDIWLRDGYVLSHVTRDGETFGSARSTDYMHCTDDFKAFAEKVIAPRLLETAKKISEKHLKRLEK